MKTKKSLRELPEPYKIVRVRATDMPLGYACYFVASSVEMAEKKADTMLYRNPQGEEISLDNKIVKEYYFEAGLEHAKIHQPCGDPDCDAFLICYKHDDERESEETKRKREGKKEAKMWEKFHRNFSPLFPFGRRN